jgi:chemotaxis protein CheC
MLPRVSFSESELDGLREIGNIGAGHAATALSQFLGDVVTLRIPRVRALALRDVPDALGGPERILVGVHLRVYGEVRGNLLLTFPPEAAAALLGRLGLPAADLHALADLSASALRELGNILASTYLNAVSQVLRRSLVPSVPGLAVDMAGAVVDLLLSEIAAATGEALVLETTFQEVGGPVRGEIFLLPDPAAIETLVRSVSGAT